MRILSGKLKGAKILTSNSKITGSHSFITRPTSDRVKESLFNIIQHGFNIDFKKITFFDCFSGSGSIGLEAISRGSLKVFFLDKDRMSCKCIAQNLNNLKINKNDQTTNFKILNNDFFDKNLLFNSEFDIIFFDPPYELIAFQEVFLRLSELRVTKTNSLIIYESNKELKGAKGLKVLKCRRIGNTFLNFIKFSD